MKSLFAGLALGALFPGSPLQAQTPLTWRNVAISGSGCFVTGVVPQPAQPGLFYLRTDVGGAYSLTGSGSGSAAAITGTFDFSQLQYYSIESIAVDPSNANDVYLAAGEYTTSGFNPGAVWMSGNQGATWSQVGSTTIPMGGNMDRRWGGERLAVVPGGGTLYFGSRTSGLWKSSGSTWSQVSSLPYPATFNGVQDVYGVLAVAVDPNSTSTVYAAVHQYGIYLSTDSGTTFSLINCTCNDVRRMTVDANGTLWVTCSAGVFSDRSGTWTNVTPSQASGTYCALAVNASGNVAVCAGDGTTQSQLFVASNPTGSSGWTELSFGTQPATNPSIPWVENATVDIDSIAFDTAPGMTGNAWMAGGGGIWYGTNLFSGTFSLKLVETGHEEAATNCLATPPAAVDGPELMAGMKDIDGFGFAPNNFGSYPQSRFGDNGTYDSYGITSSIAFEWGNPLNVVRLGAAKNQDGDALLVSSTGGSSSASGGNASGSGSWTLRTLPAVATGGTNTTILPVRVAMDSGNANNIVIWGSTKTTACSGTSVPVSVPNVPVYLSTDNGSTWSVSSGLPSGTGSTAVSETGDANSPLTADPVTAGTFYLVQAGGLSDHSPAIYKGVVSGGALTWTSQYSTGNGLPSDLADTEILRARPEVSGGGDLWLSMESTSITYQIAPRQSWEGLYHSSDGGVTWARAGNGTSGYVTRAISFGFGLGLYGAPESIYLYGRLTGDTTDKIYWSQDSGNSWTDIQSATELAADNSWDIQGSQQTYGRVFVATRGRGVIYADAQMFSDNFEGETIGQGDSNFTNDSSSFKVESSGGSNVYQSVNGAAAHVNVGGSSAWSNYYIAAEVTVSGTAESTGIMLRGRINSGVTEFYYLQLVDGNQWSIMKYDAGVHTVLASGTFDYSANTNYWLKFDLQGTTLSASASTDGISWSALGSATDSAFSSGTAGIASWATTGTFDNVVVAAGP